MAMVLWSIQRMSGWSALTSWLSDLKLHTQARYIVSGPNDFPEAILSPLSRGLLVSYRANFEHGLGA